MGFVYAIGDGRGRVKIGWSGDPLRRLAKIRSDCPSAAALFGVIPATREQEQEAHALLKPWRANREWFYLEGAVVAFVEMLPPPRPRPIDISASESPLRQYRKQNRISMQALANQLGTTHATISRYETGKRLPSSNLLVKIAKETGLSIDALVQWRVSQ